MLYAHHRVQIPHLNPMCPHRGLVARVIPKCCTLPGQARWETNAWLSDDSSVKESCQEDQCRPWDDGGPHLPWQASEAISHGFQRQIIVFLSLNIPGDVECHRMRALMQILALGLLAGEESSHEGSAAGFRGQQGAACVRKPSSAG